LDVAIAQLLKLNRTAEGRRRGLAIKKEMFRQFLQASSGAASLSSCTPVACARVLMLFFLECVAKPSILHKGH